MNNATFLNRFKEISYKSYPLVSDMKTFKQEQIINEAECLRQNILTETRNSRVALLIKETDQFIISLLALDGFASGIVILPPDLDDDVQTNLMAQNHVTYCYDGKQLKQINQPSLIEKNKVANTKWILTTSGTTGIPKSIEHSFSSLTKTTHINNKGVGFVWGLIYEAYRFAGLQVVLQSILGGSSLVLANDIDFAKQISVLNAYHVNALSATPSWWRKYLMFGTPVISLKRITLGGEISNQQLIDELRTLHLNAKIVHIYASTEAGVGFSVQDGLEGFPVRWLDDGIKDVRLKISEDNHLLIKSGTNATGEEIRKRTDNAGYIDTEDLVEVNNNRVKFVGRVSGAINVGGNKVHPEEVESVIRQLDFVDDVIVIAKKNPLIGELVQAKVCIVSDNQIEKKQIKEKIITHCKKQMADYKVPALISFVDVLEYSKTGKLVRH